MLAAFGPRQRINSAWLHLPVVILDTADPVDPNPNLAEPNRNLVQSPSVAEPSREVWPKPTTWWSNPDLAQNSNNMQTTRPMPDEPTPTLIDPNINIKSVNQVEPSPTSAEPRANLADNQTSQPHRPQCWLNPHPTLAEPPPLFLRVFFCDLGSLSRAVRVARADHCRARDALLCSAAPRPVRTLRDAVHDVARSTFQTDNRPPHRFAQLWPTSGRTSSGSGHRSWPLPSQDFGRLRAKFTRIRLMLAASKPIFWPTPGHFLPNSANFGRVQANCGRRLLAEFVPHLTDSGADFGRLAEFGPKSVEFGRNVVNSEPKRHTLFFPPMRSRAVLLCGCCVW